MSHLPGYVKLHDEFKKKGVDQIVCTSTNDAFVLYAWAKSENVPSDKVKMLSDGSSIFAKVSKLDDLISCKRCH